MFGVLGNWKCVGAYATRKELGDIDIRHTGNKWIILAMIQASPVEVLPWSIEAQDWFLEGCLDSAIYAGAQKEQHPTDQAQTDQSQTDLKPFKQG